MTSYLNTRHTGIRLVTGAASGYYLQSDAAGNASWQPLVTSGFASGSVTSPSIYFTADTATGLYLPSTGTLGVAAAGSNVLTITSSGTTFAQSTTTNLGTSGTTTPLNVYGLVTATNGLTLTAGTAKLQGSGSTTAAAASLYVNPTYTTTNTNDVYFSYLASPAITTTGGTPANATTLYLQDAPTNATNAYTLWAAAGRSYLATGMRYRITSVATATYTVLPTDFLIWVTGTAGNRTFTLPAITADNEGTMYVFVVDPTASENLTLNTSSSQKFDGSTSTSLTIAQQSTVTLIAGPVTGAATVSWWRV